VIKTGVDLAARRWGKIPVGRRAVDIWAARAIFSFIYSK